MLTERWVAVDDDGQLALFSSEGVLPERDDALRGQDVLDLILRRVGDLLVEAHLEKPLPTAGQFVPAFAVAENSTALAGLAARQTGAGAVALLDENTAKETVERLFLQPDVAVFDYEPRALSALAGLAGFLVYDPDERTPGGYARLSPRDDPFVRPAYQALYGRRVHGPCRLTDLPAGHRDRVVRLNGVRFVERNHLVPAEHGAVRALDHYQGPRHLQDGPAGSPRWPILLATGVGLAGLGIFWWLSRM